MWHTAIVSSTEWDNFWRQRCSPLAQPEMRAAAEVMQAAYVASTPQVIAPGHWHTPYIDDETRAWAWGEAGSESSFIELLKCISAARCARVSYLTHDGKRDPYEDLAMYERLITADPPHASPLEHVATPSASLVEKLQGDVAEVDKPHFGNFEGWDQLRHLVLAA
jgi:thymidylate synthase ThyX